MVDYNKRTPRQSVTIKGQSFQIPAPYAEGHTLNPNEASALNQLLAENVRNNMAKQVVEMTEGGSPVEDMQGKVDEYVAAYEFGVRRAGGRPSDPVQAKAKELAIDKVKEALKKKGLVLKDVGQAKISELADEALQKYPQLVEQARNIVAMQNDAVAGLELDLG